jgi:RelE-like toxin of type II toxin-antitoxin system HigB
LGPPWQGVRQGGQRGVCEPAPARGGAVVGGKGRLIFLYSRRRLLAEHVPKITRVLAQLDIAADANDMDLPGFHLHQLTGNLAGFWSVTVRGYSPDSTLKK